MKKIMFFALLACAALSFVGCDRQVNPPTGGGSAVTGIEVSPAELTLTLGDEYRLSYTLTPSGATANVVWTSSDTTVVYVTDKGVVTAVGYGTANVVATCGEYSGACAVKVQTYYETLTFNNACLWGVDTTYYGGQVVEIKSADGATYNCYLALAELMVCSDGFYLNNSGQLDGTELGTYISVLAPMYYGTKFLNGGEKGVSFVLGEWYIVETNPDSLYAYVAKPGALMETYYKQYMGAAVKAYNSGDSNGFYTALQNAGLCFDGATMNTLEFHSATEEGISSDGYYGTYIPDGIVTKGQFSLNTDGASEYMCGMDYNYFEFLPLASDATYTWGCNWIFNEDGTEITWKDQNIYWDEMVVYQYGELPAAEAQREMKPIFAPVMKLDYPEIAERVEKQLKQYNTLVVKK